MNLLHFTNILELMDGDWPYRPSDNLLPDDPDPAWAKETWVNKEDHITDPPIHLFTDIFKRKSLPEEVEKAIDEMTELDRPQFPSTPEREPRNGRLYPRAFTLHMIDLYDRLSREEETLPLAPATSFVILVWAILWLVGLPYGVYCLYEVIQYLF